MSRPDRWKALGLVMPDVKGDGGPGSVAVLDVLAYGIMAGLPVDPLYAMLDGIAAELNMLGDALFDEDDERWSGRATTAHGLACRVQTVRILLERADKAGEPKTETGGAS